MPRHLHRTHTRHAFSLLEISVVLTVIGLLVGASVVGISVLKQSYMQSIISDYTKYGNAVGEFKNQYGALPGDITDATDYWGDDVANCSDAAVTNGSPGTCNGDGNENMTDGNESYRAWQHMTLAKLIKGRFTGMPSGGGAVPGTNVPTTAITATGWAFGYKPATSGLPDAYDQELLNYIGIGRPYPGWSLTLDGAILASEAWQVDKKIDNALPATGRVVTLKPAALPGCATNDTNTAEYAVDTKGINCALGMSLTLK